MTSLPQATPGGFLREVAGISTVFSVTGLFMGVWGAAMPTLRDRLETDERGLAVLLVTVGLVAVAAMQVGGRAADRWGGKRPSLLGAVLLGVSFLMLITADTMAAALAAGVVFGLGHGAMDVSMNAVAVHVERLRARSTMSVIHGFFSVGNLAGAALVLLVASLVQSPAARLQVSMIAAVVLAGVLMLASWRATPESPPVVHPARHDGRRARPAPLPRVTWLLTAMAVCFGLTEGTAVDWAAVHVTDVVGVDAGTGALGVMMVSGFMVVIRLLGDPLVERFGRRTVVRAASSVAALGYLLTTTATSLSVVLAAWALVGLGIGLIAPQIYSAAGHLGGGRMLAVVNSGGYGGFLTGPGIIGAVAHSYGLANAMLVPMVSAVVLVLLSLRMPALERT